MIEQTYAIASARDFRAGTQEQLYNAVTGHPYLESQTCALALFNRPGSGRIMTIVDFYIRDLSGSNSTAETEFLVQPITDIVVGGGEDKLTGYTGKFDRDNADLPSQVHFYENPESVSLAQGILRQFRNLILYNEVRAMADICAFLPASNSSGLDNCNLFFKKGTNTQGVIIRENEGIVISPVGGLVKETIKYHVSFTVRDTSTGACYFSCMPITPDGGRVACAFWNGSGSGAVYELTNLEIMEIGNDAFPDQYSLELIEYLNPNTGIISDIYTHDSRNESLAGKIDYRRDCSTTIRGQSVGALISTPRIARGIAMDQGTCYLSGSMSLALGGMNQNLFNVRNANSNIVLREGEGVGIFKRTMTGRGKSGLFIRFTVRNKEHGYSRSQVVNN